MTRATFDRWLRDTSGYLDEEDSFVVVVRDAAAQAWLSARLTPP